MIGVNLQLLVVPSIMRMCEFFSSRDLCFPNREQLLCCPHCSPCFIVTLMKHYGCPQLARICTPEALATSHSCVCVLRKCLIVYFLSQRQPFQREHQPSEHQLSQHQHQATGYLPCQHQLSTSAISTPTPTPSPSFIDKDKDMDPQLQCQRWSNTRTVVNNTMTTSAILSQRW